MNFSSLIELVSALGGLYLLYRQNKIFEKQNEIFAAQAESRKMPEPTKAARIKTFWPMVAMSVLALLVWAAAGYDIYDRHKNPVTAGNLVGGLRLSPLHLNYVWVPPGTFSMGCLPKDDPWCEKHPEETPLHPVTITKGFWIGQTEVTVGAYKRSHLVMPSSPAFNPQWLEEDQPVVNVTWEDATAFCSADNGRLPTEAQWEYAARGKSTSPWYGDMNKIAWHLSNSNDRVHAVQQLTPNYLGLYDMLGNAWEWTRDWYDKDYYSKSPTTDPFQDQQGGTENERGSYVLRGGSWRAEEEFTRVSNRNREQNIPVKRDVVGFRCVQED